MRIANLSTKSGSMSSSDKFVTDNGTTVTKIDYNALARLSLSSTPVRRLPDLRRA